MSQPLRDIFLQLTEACFYHRQQLVFDRLNWTIHKGEQWAVTGGIGSGKSSLVEAITGKYMLKQGQVLYPFLDTYKATSNTFVHISDYVSVVSFREASPAFNYANYYYQQRFNAAHTEGILTAEDFLSSVASRSTVAEQENLYRLLDIQELLPLEFIKLSNGQTRKLRIAKALLAKPELLILDNAFTGLDAAARNDLKSIINQVISSGTQVIITSTPTDLPESITHVLHLEKFKIKGVYTREEFLRTPPFPERAITPPSTLTLPMLPWQEPDFNIAFQFNHVQVQYGQKVALENIQWTIPKGEKWALLGPNGSGKSTLLSLINADHPQAYANDIILFDKKRGSGESIWEIKQKIGFVSPELHLYFGQNLPCREVAASGFFDTLYVNKLLNDTQQKIIREHFKFFHLEHLLEKNFGGLSTGEQRLVLLIRSVIKHPQVIIWDEPFQGLDEPAMQMATRLLQLYCHPSTTLIFVSHYIHEIPQFVDKYLYLNKGRISKIEILT